MTKPTPTRIKKVIEQYEKEVLNPALALMEDAPFETGQHARFHDLGANLYILHDQLLWLYQSTVLDSIRPVQKK